MAIYLRCEFGGSVQRRQRVMAGFSKEVGAARRSTLLEQIDHIWCPTLHLLNGSPGDRKTDLESTLMPLDQVKHQCGRWPVTLVGHLFHDRLVRIAVEVERIASENRIAAKTKGLVDLKVEADGCHEVSRLAGRRALAGLSRLPFMDKLELAARIAETAVLRGQFTLRSGRTSTWYIDKYRFSTKPDILRSLGGMIAASIPEGTTLLAGAELGGIPLVTTAAMAADLPCLFVRNQKKDYGTAQRFEGAVDASDHVVLVEDVATTGGQVLEAAADIAETGAKVSTIVAVVDRMQGARERIEEAGYTFLPLFTVEDLGIDPSQP
jgi:orotate phosphoribosyltransferase